MKLHNFSQIVFSEISTNFSYPIIKTVLNFETVCVSLSPLSLSLLLHTLYPLCLVKIPLVKERTMPCTYIVYGGMLYMINLN